MPEKEYIYLLILYRSLKKQNSENNHLNMIHYAGFNFGLWVGRNQRHHSTPGRNSLAPEHEAFHISIDSHALDKKMEGGSLIPSS